MRRLPTILDTDVLRSFVTGLDLGRFAEASQRLGRSAFASSLPVRMLEDQVGRPLLRWNAREFAPMEAGEMLPRPTRRRLDLNQAALEAVAAAPEETDPLGERPMGWIDPRSGTVRTARGLPAGVEGLDPKQGRPPLPAVHLGLRRSCAIPAAAVGRRVELLRSSLTGAAT